MSGIKMFMAGAGLGAGLAYFFDPDNGNRRRSVVRDRTAGTARSGVQQAEQAAQAAGAQAHGLKQKATHLSEEPKPQPDDVTLARKVETEIFRGADVPKGSINVNAEDGIVYLRGEVKRPEDVKELGKAAGAVEGVRGVENLLHTPGSEPKAKKEDPEKAKAKAKT
jgi:osmotically-inducible protein OsmY